MTLSCFSAGLAVIASAADWVKITGYKYEPVTLYVKQIQLTSGQKYLFGVSNSSFIMDTSFTGQTVTRKNKGTSAYYTKNDGSDVKYYADNFYIVDETNNYYYENEYLWKNSKLYNESLKKYLTSNTSGALTLASSTSYTWSQTVDTSDKLHLMVNDKYLHLVTSTEPDTYDLYKNTATSNITVFAYQKTTVYKKVVDDSTTGYYIYNGQTNFDIPVGSTFNDSIVKNAISVIYRETEGSEAYQSLTINDSRISLKWNETVNTEEMGDYTATLYVMGEPLATLTVTVGDQGPVLVNKEADPSTSNLKNKFRGTSADDGKVLTDKTVQNKSDEYGAYAIYDDDEFSITLSALGQSYPIVETEETPKTEKIHPDVIFVIDASASMLEQKVAGSSTVSRAEATATALNSAIKSLYEADPETRVGIVTFNDNWNETGVYLPLDKYTLPEGQTDYVLWNGRNLAKSSSSGNVTGTYPVRTVSSSKTATAVTLAASPISSTNGVVRPDDSELTFLATSNGVSYYVGYYNKSIFVFRDGIEKRFSVFSSSGNINTIYVDENIKITRTGTGTDKSVSYQTYSYSNKTGNFNLQFESIDNVISTNFLINSAGNVVRPSSYQFHYSCGTFTQAGIKAAENMFNQYAGTDLSHRIPTVVLITDGIPTVGDPNTSDPCLKLTMGVTEGYGYSDADAVTSQSLANLGLYTIKTGMHVKESVNELYSQYWEEGSSNFTSFYTIGPGVDYIFGQTVLDPSAKNLNEAKKETVGLGGECGNAVAVDLYNTITNELGYEGSDFVDYADWSYTGNLSGSELEDAFEQITKSIVYVSRPLDSLESAENDMVKSKAAMIFTDTIGSGMELRDDPVLRYNSINFRPSSKSTKEVGDSTVTTYTYNYKVKEVSSGKIYSLSDCLAEVITEPDGKQIVKWYISAELVPMICYDDENQKYDYIDPIRLIYKVGIADKNEIATYFANSTTEPAGAEYYPVIGNPYYYDNVEGEDGKLHSVLKNTENARVAKSTNVTDTLPNSSETTVNSNATVSVTLGNNGVETLKSTAVTLTKVWDDINNTYGARPDSITLQVYRDGLPYKDPVVISSSDVIISKDSDGKDIWKYTIPNLPYSEDSVYTLKEVNVDENYKPSYSEDTLTITNKIIETDVDIDKWADGDKLKDTGVARVHLTATGVPTNFPVDVLFVTDLSNSMYWQTGTSTYATEENNGKIDVLKDSLSNFADDFLSNNSSGSGYNNTISFVGFGGIDKDYLDNYDTVAKVKRYTDVTHTLFTSEESIENVKSKVNDITYNYDDGNVYLTFDGTVAPVDSNKLGLAYGGTNYDHGFMEAAKAVETIKQEYYEKTGEEYDMSERQIYVLFITDGAPTHWNGKTYTGTPKDMTRADANAMWLNENGEKVRYNYIGANQAGWYEYISSNPNYWATKVVNLPKVTGMSAVGIDMAHGGFDKYVFTEESGYPLDTVIENIVDGYTVETLFADSSADLADDILALANKVNGCGSNAYVMDTMGSQYDLQMAAAVNCGIADKGTLSLEDYGITPSITVTLYDTYKSTSVGTTVDGVTVTRDMVGERTGKDAIELEKVTFSADGTQAFSDRLDGNIMKNGVIYAEHFTYNTNSSAVTLTDGTVLPAETFKWYIGYLPQNEIELSYDVYLTDSMEGNRPEGTYDTNEEAVLYYKDNFDAEHELVYPVPNLPWNEAKLSYELYLVDAQGNPVTENGEKTSFENRTVVSELKGIDVYLNTHNVIDYDELLEILPDGYFIFNPQASYTGNISSNNSLSKSYISDGTETTKVFDPSTAVTGSMGAVNGIEDYTDVKVAFAVVKIAILPDVIVVDYGKTILCSPLDNDTGATALVGLSDINAAATDKPSDSVTSENGVFRTEDNNVIFSLFSYTSKINRVRYYASIANSNNSSLVLNSTISVIPATTVYYEDDFGGSSENGGLYIKYTGAWSQISDNGSKTAVLNANTDTGDRQDRGEVGEGHVPYGYDSSYTECTQFSNGTASVVNGTISKDANGNRQFDAYAEFTFTGTGFDIISRTDLDCGTISVAVYNADNELVANVPVINKGIQNLYQIPVISYTGIPYGTYSVRINVNAPQKLLGITGSTFYLDAIRIYDPMGLCDDDNPEYGEAYEAYYKDREANAYIASIRDYILSIDDLGVDESSGAVYVDTIDNDYSSGAVISKDAIKDFEIIGPNEEVYLTPGKGIGFALVCSEIPESVQLGIKIPAPLSNSAAIYVQTLGHDDKTFTKEINSAEEMFYEITDAVHFTKVQMPQGSFYRAVVVLSNGLENAVASDVISITNVKMTYNSNVTNIVECKDEDKLETTALVSASIEENGEISETVAVGMMASWGIYCDVFETVYVQHQASVPNYDVILAENFKSVKHGDSASAVFKTTQHVEGLTLTDENGNKVEAKAVCELDEASIYTEDYKTARTWTVTINNADEGTHTYTVCAANGEGLSATAKLTVTPREITELRIVKLPVKTDYDYGESIDTTGMVLEAVYSDGTVKEITYGYALSTQKANHIGTKNVKVSYDGLQTSFKINVKLSLIRFVLIIFGLGWVKVK